jgi:hypothetical protein
MGSHVLFGCILKEIWPFEFSDIICHKIDNESHKSFYFGVGVATTYKLCYEEQTDFSYEFCQW